jgi:MFS family permease
MDLIDSSVANLAGPSIRADLGGGQVTVQWVLSAYTAAFALGLVTSGRLGDLLGRRRLFLLGMTGFTLASLACGLAPDVVFLIVARTLQGLFGSVMIPQGLALMTAVFPLQHLRKALTPVGPVMGAATVAGPILAGWLLHLNLFGSQWRSIFLINIPFVLIINLLLQLGLRWTPLHTGLTLIPWALGTAVAVLLAGAVLAEKLGRASLHPGPSVAVTGLLALWWSVAHWGAGITVWKLAPALVLTGFGSGLVFVPLFDFILGDATTEEVGTGAGLLNAVQQFAGAIGVAALGTVFFARVGHPTAGSYFAAAELVFGIAAALYILTLLLVGLLPRHAQRAHG